MRDGIQYKKRIRFIFVEPFFLLCGEYLLTRWLRIESQLLQLDAQIKSNLGLDRADADKCLHAMDDMLALPIDPLMLKKHPQIVETVRRVRINIHIKFNIDHKVLVLLLKNFIQP